MKKIPLWNRTGKNTEKIVKYANVDDCDYARLTKGAKWYYQIDKSGRQKTTYARRGERKGGVFRHYQMHRVILGLRHGDGILSDHINGNGVDNRRSNLRRCSMTQNLRNRGKYACNKSGWRGVHWCAKTAKYIAQINNNGSKRTYLGSYTSPKQAYAAYLGAARILHGEFFHEYM